MMKLFYFIFIVLFYKKKRNKKFKDLNSSSKILVYFYEDKNGRTTLLAKCAVCDSKKCKFIKEQEASGLLSSLGIRTFCGPFNKNKERIQKFKDTGDSQYIYQNKLDKACFQQDKAYGDFKDFRR